MHSILILFATASVASCHQIAVAWGQDFSYRIFSGEHQKSLKHYCENTASDIITLSFAYDSPQLKVDFQNQCTETFSGSQLSHCSQIGKDIASCQEMGKKILLTLSSGETLTSNQKGKDFATTLVDTFGPGIPKKQVLRPFDSASVDGFVLAPSHGLSSAYSALAKQIKTLAPSMLLAAAPSCLESDPVLQDALGSVAFDYWFVEFYYSTCRIGRSEFNWQDWSESAKLSPNPKVKVFVSLVADNVHPQFGYVDANDVRKKLPIFKDDASFGGFAVFDASMSERNNDYVGQLRNLLD